MTESITLADGSDRLRFLPISRYDDVGFRCAREVVPPRVLRGGSWLNYQSHLCAMRAINRGRYHPDFRSSAVGFRCAREVVPLRVLRGGSWLNIQTLLRAANRVWDHPDGRSLSAGFRCARNRTAPPISSNLSQAHEEKPAVNYIRIPPAGPAENIQEFELADAPVTQGEWFAVMGTRPWQGNDHVVDDDNRPAVCVSFHDAEEFCRRLTANPELLGLDSGGTIYLPTEAQWEHACRAGTTRDRWFADSEVDDCCWHYDNVPERAAQPVRRKRPNPWGLYDMLGNVWEWTSSAWK